LREVKLALRVSLGVEGGRTVESDWTVGNGGATGVLDYAVDGARVEERHREDQEDGQSSSHEYLYHQMLAESSTSFSGRRG
jgi:hypothetical protein